MIYVKSIEYRVITFAVEAESIKEAQELVGDGEFPDVAGNYKKVKDIQIGKYSPTFTYSTKPLEPGTIQVFETNDR